MSGDRFEMDGLGKTWDDVASIRDRLKAGKRLVTCKSSHDSSIPECVQNQEVLIPVLHRSFACKLKLPEIEGLREQIGIVYTKSLREPTDSEIDDDGWDIRKMIRFLKRKATRDDPSQDSRWHFLDLVSLFIFTLK